jgi:phosphoglycerate dehydrogenase-like enzyme
LSAWRAAVAASTSCGATSTPTFRFVPRRPCSSRNEILPRLARSSIAVVNARRLACFKPGSRFYNIGRGTSVDHRALIDSLRTGRIAEAYLDVFEVEPLPPSDPLWTTPNLYITPHTAGGRADQDAAIVKHFLRNLDAFTTGAPMTDRIV